MVDAAQLEEIDPTALFDDIGFATFEPKSGYVDAIAATRSMIDAAVRAGVYVREGVTATRVRASESRVTGVETTGGVIEANRVILACGPWTPSLTTSAGVNLPITAQRVQVAIFQMPITLPHSVRTYVDNVAAIFCRPWGNGRIMVGLGGGEIHDLVDPDSFEWRNDAAFPEIARSAMEQRFPSFAYARYLHGHSGLYDMTPDGHPVIGEAGPDGLWIVAGFSGAGFKKGPAVGMAVAGAISGNLSDQNLLAPFRLDRDWHAPWSPYEYRLAHDFGHGF
jgi:sarcosine oxidase subunit beta